MRNLLKVFLLSTALVTSGARAIDSPGSVLSSAVSYKGAVIKVDPTQLTKSAVITANPDGSVTIVDKGLTETFSAAQDAVTKTTTGGFLDSVGSGAKNVLDTTTGAVKSGWDATTGALKSGVNAAKEGSKWAVSKVGGLFEKGGEAVSGVPSVMSSNTVPMDSLLSQADGFGATDAAASMSKAGVTSIEKLDAGQFKVSYEGGDGYSSFMSAEELDAKFGDGASELADGTTAKAATDSAKGAEGAGDAGEAAGVADKGKEAANVAPSFKALEFNIPQYALVIYEATLGKNIDDATKQVKVKGADPMQSSQGQQSAGATTATSPNVAMAATTISGASDAMIELLKTTQIDLSLLSTEFKKEETPEVPVIPTPDVIDFTGSRSQTGLDRTTPTPSSTSSTMDSTTEEEDGLTTTQRKELAKRRALLLAEWATAATQVGEGSNAISSAFYDRAAGFASAANGAVGSLGGISTITDTDRFVLFELTRGAALSSVQLALQGAVNLNDLGEEDDEEEDDAPAEPTTATFTGSSSQ